MAVREFKVEITPLEGNEEVYIHDNNAVERITLPAIQTYEHEQAHAQFLLLLSCYMRCHKCSKVEVTKVP